MDAPVNVPIDNPNADTEWFVSLISSASKSLPFADPNVCIYRNDILRKHGVIPEKPPSPTPIIQEAIEEARKKAHENRLEDKDLDELDALEDDEDEAFLEHYRYVCLPSLTGFYGRVLMRMDIQEKAHGRASYDIKIQHFQSGPSSAKA